MQPIHHHNLDDSSSPQLSPRVPFPNKSASQLLDSLVSFYRQEMMWVYRTRASLELAEPSISTTLNDDPPDQPVPESSPSSTIVVDEEPKVVVKKTEPRAASASHSPMVPSSRWDKRKHKFKLKLEGLSLPVRRPGRPVVYGVSESGMRVLELFENMMETRMESCQRVNVLVRRANRANLFAR